MGTSASLTRSTAGGGVQTAADRRFFDGPSFCDYNGMGDRAGGGSGANEANEGKGVCVTGKTYPAFWFGWCFFFLVVSYERW